MRWFDSGRGHPALTGPKPDVLFVSSNVWRRAQVAWKRAGLNERGRVRLAKLLDELGQRVEVGAAPAELETAPGPLRLVPTTR